MRRLNPGRRVVGTLAVAAVLVVAAALTWAPSDGRGDPGLEGAVRAASPGAVPPSVERAGSGERDPASRDVQRVDPTPAVHLGRLVVLDARGRSCGARSGTFRVEAPDGTSTRVTVFDGRFELDPRIPAGSALVDLVLGDQRATFDEPRLSVPPTVAVEHEWVARWDHLGSMRVVDATSGLDVHGVTVLAAGTPLDSEAPHPPESVFRAPLVEDADSPFPVPLGTAARTLWVGAAGHAWKRVTHLVQDGEMVVPLEPGGVLLVGAPSRDTWRGAHYARVYRDGECIASRSLVNADVARIEGLPVGPVRVRLEVGRRGSPQAVLATLEVEVRAGAETSVLFRHADQDVEPAALTLLADLGSDSEFRAGARVLGTHRDARVPPFTLDASAFQPQGGGPSRLDLPSVEPGTWDLVLEPFGCTARVTAAAGRREVVQFEVGTPARVLVVPVEQGTDRIVGAAFLHWRRVTEGNDASWSSVAPGPDGRFTFHALPGPIEAFVAEVGYSAAPQTHAVTAGVNELVLDLVPEAAIPVEITLQDDGARVPLALDAWRGFELRASGHAGRQTQRTFSRVRLGTSLASARIDLIVDRPGRYDLVAGDVPGHVREHAVPIVVDVSADRLNRVVVELERANPGTGDR